MRDANISVQDQLDRRCGRMVVHRYRGAPVDTIEIEAGIAGVHNQPAEERLRQGWHEPACPLQRRRKISVSDKLFEVLQHSNSEIIFMHRPPL